MQACIPLSTICFMECWWAFLIINNMRMDCMHSDAHSVYSVESFSLSVTNRVNSLRTIVENFHFHFHTQLSLSLQHIRDWKWNSLSLWERLLNVQNNCIWESFNRNWKSQRQSVAKTRRKTKTKTITITIKWNVCHILWALTVTFFPFLCATAFLLSFLLRLN